MVITLFRFFKKKIFSSALFIVFSIASLSFFSIAHAQIAVPVIETAGSPLLLSTQEIEFLAADISANTFDTAYNTNLITLKEVGPAGVPGTGLDSIAKGATQIIIKQFTGSLINWINGGFNGAPQFVTDPATFFINTADRVAGDFIQNDAGLGFLCSPFKLQIKLALNINYSHTFRDRIGCTLTDVVNNVEGFTNDFSQGGWNTWFRITQNPQNNPSGAYLIAQTELSARIAGNIAEDQQKLDWGKGFLSTQECLESNIETQQCQRWSEIKTPGTIVNDQLSNVLGDGLRQLELADEFDEILSAALGQLIQQVVTRSGGLIGN